MEQINSSGSVLELRIAGQSLALAKAMVPLNSEAAKHLETVGLALDEIEAALAAHRENMGAAADSFEWLIKWAGDIFQDEEAAPHVKKVCAVLGRVKARI